MPVEDTIVQSLERFGQLTTKARIKQAIVIPILQALGWNYTDPDEVEPDHRGSVDYALFHEGNPLIFIIVRPRGNVTPSGVEPIFEFAHNGVPFLILTDGKMWDFFLGNAAGVLQERRFLRIELKPDRIDKDAQLFSQFLSKERVSEKQAIREAERLLRLLSHNRERSIAQNTIPKVWPHLVDNEDTSLLYEVIKEAVQVRCGHQPANEDVKKFLTGLAMQPRPPIVTVEPTHPQTPTPCEPGNGRFGFSFDGRHKYFRSNRCRLVGLIRIFQDLDETFIERFSTLANARRTRTRKLVATNLGELYGGRYDLPYSVLRNGWYIGINLPGDQMIRDISDACAALPMNRSEQPSTWTSERHSLTLINAYPPVAR